MVLVTVEMKGSTFCLHWKQLTFFSVIKSQIAVKNNGFSPLEEICHFYKGLDVLI